HHAGAADLRPGQRTIAPDELRAAELRIDDLEPEGAAPQRTDPLGHARAEAGEQIGKSKRADVVERPSILVQAGVAQRMHGEPRRQAAVDHLDAVSPAGCHLVILDRIAAVASRRPMKRAPPVSGRSWSTWF